jgi:hypothetical protein
MCVCFLVSFVCSAAECLPDTIVAVVQSHIDSLHPSLQMVLKVSSALTKANNSTISLAMLSEVYPGMCSHQLDIPCSFSFSLSLSNTCCSLHCDLFLQYTMNDPSYRSTWINWLLPICCAKSLMLQSFLEHRKHSHTSLSVPSYSK